MKKLLFFLFLVFSTSVVFAQVVSVRTPKDPIVTSETVSEKESVKEEKENSNEKTSKESETPKPAKVEAVKND